MSFLTSLFGSPDRRLEAIITDVTRMQGDRICIAALCGKRTIRLHDPQPREQHWRALDHLAPGDVVSVTWRPVKRYRPPHAEDGNWNPATFEKVGKLSVDEFVARLSELASRTLVEAFGQPWFRTQRGNAAFKPRGQRSIVSVRAKRVIARRLGDAVRVDFSDGEREWKTVPLEDLAVRTGSRPWQMTGDEAVLRVGLGRPYQAGPDKPPACFLQVNHIFPIDQGAS